MVNSGCQVRCFEFPQWVEPFTAGPLRNISSPPLPLARAAVVMVTERRLVSSGFIHTFVSGLYQATEWRAGLQVPCVKTTAFPLYRVATRLAESPSGWIHKSAGWSGPPSALLLHRRRIVSKVLKFIRKPRMYKRWESWTPVILKPFDLPLQENYRLIYYKYWRRSVTLGERDHDSVAANQHSSKNWSHAHTYTVHVFQAIWASTSFFKRFQYKESTNPCLVSIVHSK